MATCCIARLVMSSLSYIESYFLKPFIVQRYHFPISFLSNHRMSCYFGLTQFLFPVQITVKYRGCMLPICTNCNNQQ